MASETRERVVAELKRAAEVWRSPHEGDDNPLSDLLREAAALLSGSGTPPGEGERWEREYETISKLHEQADEDNAMLSARYYRGYMDGMIAARAAYATEDRRAALRSAPSGVEEGDQCSHLFDAVKCIYSGTPSPRKPAAPVPAREGEEDGEWGPYRCEDCGRPIEEGEEYDRWADDVRTHRRCPDPAAARLRGEGGGG